MVATLDRGDRHGDRRRSRRHLEAHLQAHGTRCGRGGESLAGSLQVRVREGHGLTASSRSTRETVIYVLLVGRKRDVCALGPRPFLVAIRVGGVHLLEGDHLVGDGSDGGPGEQPCRQSQCPTRTLVDTFCRLGGDRPGTRSPTSPSASWRVPPGILRIWMRASPLATVSPSFIIDRAHYTFVNRRLIRLDRRNHASVFVIAAQPTGIVITARVPDKCRRRLFSLRRGGKNASVRDDDPRECLNNIEHLRGAGLTSVLFNVR